jgi:hypothetical protein
MWGKEQTWTKGTGTSLKDVTKKNPLQIIVTEIIVRKNSQMGQNPTDGCVSLSP